MSNIKNTTKKAESMKAIKKWWVGIYGALFGHGQDVIPEAKDETRTLIEGHYIYRITRKQRLSKRPDGTTAVVVLWDVRRSHSISAQSVHGILTEIVTPRGDLVRFPTTAQLIYAVDRHFNTAAREREIADLMSSLT